jgi:hypothetical protein
MRECEECGEELHEPAFPSILEDPSWGNPHSYKPLLETDYPHSWMAVVKRWTPQELIALRKEKAPDRRG